MATPKGKYDKELLRYGQACMLESKEKYYTQLSNTITNFNEDKNTQLSNVKIEEAFLRAMIEH